MAMPSSAVLQCVIDGTGKPQVSAAEHQFPRTGRRRTIVAPRETDAVETCPPVIAADSVAAESRLDASIKKNLSKAIRTLKLVVLRRTVNAIPLFGAGSKVMSLIFSLNKTPDKAKVNSLQVHLPHPMLDNRPVEAHFLKIGGRRLLQLNFGWGNMEEDCLNRNAIAIIRAVWTRLDKRLMREIRVLEMDGLDLPVWDPGGRKKRKSQAFLSSLRLDAAINPMGPPNKPPAKKVRIA